MSDIKVFESSDFGTLSVIYEDGKPFFPASDCAKILGYKDPYDAIKRHAKGSVKRRVLTNGGEQDINFISEGDLYRLITHSKLPSAERFEKWVFDEVLPAIRQTGGYIAGESEMTDEELLSRALVMANEKIKHRDERIKLLESKAKEDAPRVLFAQAVEGSEDSVLIRDMAKILKQNGVDIGQDRLFALLRKEGYLISQKGESWNQPTQKSMNLGLMEIKKTTVMTPSGTKVRGTPKITGKGQIYFVNRYAYNAG